MSVIETIEAIRSGLMWICLSALAAIAADVIGAWLRREVASAMRRLLTVARTAAFVAVSAFCVIRGGAKFLMPPPSTGGTPVVPVVVTPEEIAQGWRLESVVTNDAVSYAMPTNGVEYAPWSLGGGYEMHFPLDLGDFAFPFGTGVVHRLDVLSGGMVESLPRQRMKGRYSSAMSICAAREYASIVPGVGRFWWADAVTAVAGRPPYRGKVLTWENVYAGRDRTGQYNAQIEFHADGNFITRSNNVERVYRRVLPYDLDNDGLPNTIDPAPETPVIPSAWNQSEAWAAAAFPSNAAEIAAMGGYAAWVAARGAEPDRRLVTLGVTFDDGSAWPTLLNFGDILVVADGAAELVFAIDCGAKVPFSLTTGRLGSLAVTATEPPTRSGEGMTTTESSEFLGNYVFPHERTVNDVKVHLDDPCTGWLCRLAGVNIDGDLDHLHPGDSAELTAEVSHCHPNAYLGCTWTGGEGIQFSDEHSLSTTVTYDSTSTVEWATNGIDLITYFLGYSLTNHINVTVGVQVEPSLEFSLGCQGVFFLNDVELGLPSNRAERIRPVTLNLTGPVGTNGTVQLSVQGNINPVLFQVEDGVTNRVTSETVFPLAVTDDFAHTGSSTFYMSCPNLGTGTITATFTPADGGEPLTDSVTFRCIEPLRKLVNSQRDVSAPRIVNPSRLVYGTNAVLCVDYNGPFQESEIHWHVKEGSATVNPTVGKRVVVTPTVADGVVTVEARFNGDEIQPQFVLPIVQERVLDVRAFVVCTENDGGLKVAMEDNEIHNQIQAANVAFGQVGIIFNLVGIEPLLNSSNYWNIVVNERTGLWPFRNPVLSRQVRSLIQAHNVSGCINIYFVGDILKGAGDDSSPNGFRVPGCVFVKSGSPDLVLAHEFGHALGLWDCYDSYSVLGDENSDEDPLVVPDAKLPISASRFRSHQRDWGHETGRGFYASADTYLSILQQFLMYGEVSEWRYNFDIPDDAVRCLNNNNHQEVSFGFGEIGATNLKPTNEGVYAK